MTGPEPIHLFHVFDDYAVISILVDHVWSAPFPVELSAVAAAPSYAPLVTAIHRHLVDTAPALRDGSGIIEMTAARLGIDSTTGLPVYDLVAADARTSTEMALHAGYGAIDLARIPRLEHDERLLAAMTQARTSHAGVWGEWTAGTYAQSLPFTLVAQTQPAPHVAGDSLIRVLSIPVILALLFVLAMRDGRFRHLPKGPWYQRLGGSFLGFYTPGAYRSLPRDEASAAAGTHTP